jgi:hypothetical protein
MNFEEENAELNFLYRWGMKFWITVLGVLLAVSILVFVLNRTVQTVDTGLVRYQEFQEIYGTCESLKTKICNLKEIPEKDKMFNDISKDAQLTGLRNNLARWVNEYNSKSKLINFSVWKSDRLPYTLAVENFDCK